MNPTIGMEGKFVARGAFSGKKIGVLTSGGDSQGMNSAVRAVVRTGIYVGAQVYFIKEGYQGMVDGGDNIALASWSDVSGIMQQGGTVIGSARCTDFREHAGRLKAAKHLVEREITNLVVIGGDGSLTGANLFRQEWSTLLKELAQQGEISEGSLVEYGHLNIVGLVGSIDNDFCGTDMTIGTDTALHRIIEACDAIVTTAQSHQRCFILEVMGRHCGYLALVAALASEADWVFIPESPPEDDWQEKLCRKLIKSRSHGQRVNIIIIAEGAIDRQCKAIKAGDVESLIKTRLKIDTRTTILGHVQRGGQPSSFDRVLGIRMGAEAVMALMDADRDPSIPACVISLDGNQAVRVPLMRCVEKTRAVADAMGKMDFEEAVKLRGKSFANNLSTYLKLSKIDFAEISDNPNILRLGIMNIGAPACGMNAAMRSFIRMAVVKGYQVVGIYEGIHGLLDDDVHIMTWQSVRGWAGAGGSELGARRPTPKDLGIDKVAAKLKEHKISGLLVLGGFEAYLSVMQMAEARQQYNAFCIPMVCIPATISNNVPGTDFSLGADTSINEITSIIDKIKQSAIGTKRRVFVVETMGAYCGYLATMGGLSGGADQAYIFEEEFTVDDLRADVKHMCAKIADNVQRGLIVRSEKANDNYTSDFITKMYSQEGKGVFDCRLNILGHMQQGGTPSPFDRNLGTKKGVKAIDWMDDIITKTCVDGQVYTIASDTACLLGLLKRQSTFTPILSLKEQTDFKRRIPKNQWWLNLRPLMRIMAKHESLYESESIMIGTTK